MPKVDHLKQKSLKRKLEEGADQAEFDADDTPKSFVFNLKAMSKWGNRLMLDTRRIFEPNTASQLTLTKSNKLKDLESVAPVYKITDFVMFSQSSESINVRFAKFPQGPTCYFRVRSYMLQMDIARQSKHSGVTHALFSRPCVLILNNFKAAVSSNAPSFLGDTEIEPTSKNEISEKHMTLIQHLFQNMFPSIDVESVKIPDLKRALLINYNEHEDLYEFRHYKITSCPTSLSRSIKKVIASNKKLMDLSRLEDISELITNPNSVAFSESEFTDQESVIENQGLFPASITPLSSKSSIRLYEIGPRMDLDLFKICAGLNTGEVLYHKYITKTAEEALATKRRIESNKELKAFRKRKQEENVAKKLQLKEERRAKKAAPNVSDDDNDDNDDKIEDDNVGDHPSSLNS